MCIRIFVLFGLGYLMNCSPKEKFKPEASSDYIEGEFGYDLNFLRQYHSDLVLLGEDTAGAQVIILPAYQGRIMTSTANGLKGISYGWVNHDQISSGKLSEHINLFGGEERIWLGPEGGQYSIYFRRGVSFTFDNWFVPKELDTEPFTLISSTSSEAKFEKEMHLENYSGAIFDIKVNRNIRLISSENVSSLLAADIPKEVQVVAFESENILSNIGAQSWTKKNGLLSIWILSMLNASDSGLVAIPYKQGLEKDLGSIVTDNYFGKIPSDRLKIKGGLLVFKADANYRSKIGISPMRAMSWLCSYDPTKSLLTIAQFSIPSEAKEYVNSLWEQQNEPFKGDVVNSYNDGPLENGIQMGKFYEIESSSPAVELNPGETLKHIHRTIHLQGSKASLDRILNEAFSIKLTDISVD